MKAMTLRLTPAMAEQLAIVAQVEGKPIVTVVREAIRQYTTARLHRPLTRHPEPLTHPNR